MSNIEPRITNEVNPAIDYTHPIPHMDDIEYCINNIIRRINYLDDTNIDRAVGIIDGVDVGPLVKTPSGKLSYLTLNTCRCDVMPFILDKVSKLYQNKVRTGASIGNHYLECYQTIPKYSRDIELLRNIVNKHSIAFNLAMAKSNPLSNPTPTNIIFERYPPLAIVLLIGLKLNKISLADIS